MTMAAGGNTRGNTTTTMTGGDVGAHIAAIEDETKRADSAVLMDLMARVTGEEPRMWGSIVGFGRYHYRYETGHEGETCITGFAPRKSAISIYLHGAHFPDVVAKRDAFLASLGRHSMGKGCLYVKKLEHVDLTVLEDLVRLSVDTIRKHYPD